MEKRELIPGCGIGGLIEKRECSPGCGIGEKNRENWEGGWERKGGSGGAPQPPGGVMREGGAPKKIHGNRGKKWEKWDFCRIFLLSLSLFQPRLPPVCHRKSQNSPRSWFGVTPPFPGFFCSQLIPTGKKKGGKGQKPQKPPKFRGCGCTGNPPKENSRFSCPAPSARGREFGNLGIWGIPSPSSRGKEAPGKIPGFGMGREKGDGDGGNGVGWEGTGENGMKWGENGMKWEKNWMKWGGNGMKWRKSELNRKKNGMKWEKNGMKWEKNGIK